MGLGLFGESASGKSKLSAEGGTGSTLAPGEASILSYFLAYPRSLSLQTPCASLSCLLACIFNSKRLSDRSAPHVQCLMNKVAPHLDSSLFLLREGNYNVHYQLLNEYPIGLGTTLII